MSTMFGGALNEEQMDLPGPVHFTLGRPLKTVRIHSPDYQTIEDEISHLRTISFWTDRGGEDSLERIVLLRLDGCLILDDRGNVKAVTDGDLFWGHTDSEEGLNIAGTQDLMCWI